MLEVAATVFLLGAGAAFAICAVLLNEGEHARRGRRLPVGVDASPAEGAGSEPGGLGELSADGRDGLESDDRRLPVGDFLFGALYLRDGEPLAFSALADAAAGSGMSVAQVLAWIERAETGGLIERVADGESGAQPAVRLTEAGIDLARNNRRREDGTRRPAEADAARTPAS